MWDGDVWGPRSEPVFVDAMKSQAEAFAHAIRGEPRKGAGGQDVVAALEAAERIAASLAGSGAGT
jgi:predicted dehydrogenase